MNSSESEDIRGYLDDPKNVIGRRWHYEYHCWEDPKSTDADLWYRSHKSIMITGFSEDADPGIGDTYLERSDNGSQHVYHGVFDDGHEGEVFEDELHLNPSEFTRPDPPQFLSKTRKDNQPRINEGF